MFAHQVIEDIKKFSEDMKKISPAGISVWEKELKLLPYIRKSQKFHMGDLDDVNDVFKKDIGSILFGPSEQDLRLPYPIMWFDYSIRRLITTENPEHISSTNDKEGALVVKVSETLWRVSFYTHFIELDRWMFCPVKFAIGIGGFIGGFTDDNDKLLNDLSGGVLPSIKDLLKEGPILPLITADVGKVPDHQKLSDLIKEYAWNFQAVQCSVKLLNCKNIVTEKILPPARLNKKRRSLGKQELFDYHVLNVYVPSDKHDYHIGGVPLSHNRVHLCRGHFKNYTEEHPLFGKFTGMYWWQASIRGQNKGGIVMKDYQVKGLSREK